MPKLAKGGAGCCCGGGSAYFEVQQRHPTEVCAFSPTARSGLIGKERVCPICWAQACCTRDYPRPPAKRWRARACRPRWGRKIYDRPRNPRYWEFRGAPAAIQASNAFLRCLYATKRKAAEITGRNLLVRKRSLKSTTCTQITVSCVQKVWRNLMPSIVPADRRPGRWWWRGRTGCRPGRPAAPRPWPAGGRSGSRGLRRARAAPWG